MTISPTAERAYQDSLRLHEIQVELLTLQDQFQAQGDVTSVARVDQALAATDELLSALRETQRSNA